MKHWLIPFYRWYWSTRYQQWDLRLTRLGKSLATVFPNGVWFTWDRNGTGMENSKCRYHQYMRFEELHYAAKVEAFEACITQSKKGTNE